MFRQSQRETPTKAPKSIEEKRKTFINFKNLPAGKHQEKHVVYKIRKKNGKYYNYLYVGCPYLINIARNENGEKEILSGIILLQDENSNMFIVPTDEGRKIYLTNTWAFAEIRTFLHYVPALTEIVKTHDETSEYLFDINTVGESFKAIGEGINGKEFMGYKIQYVKKLELENEEKLEENSNELEEEFENTDLSDLLN